MTAAMSRRSCQGFVKMPREMMSVVAPAGGCGDLSTANAFDATNSSHSTRAMIAGTFLFMPNRTDYPWYCDGAYEGF